MAQNRTEAHSAWTGSDKWTAAHKCISIQNKLYKEQSQGSLPSLACGMWGLGEVLGLEGTRWVSFGAGRENVGNKLVKLHSN